MKILKKLIIISTILTFSLGLFACGGEDVSNFGEHTVEEIQDDPAAFLGEITLTGIVGAAETRDFSLQNELGTF